MLATNLLVNDKITASHQTNISPKELTSNKNVREKKTMNFEKLLSEVVFKIHIIIAIRFNPLYVYPSMPFLYLLCYLNLLLMS